MAKTSATTEPAYAAFLRGINVGGNKTVKMADLKIIFEKLGFIDVKTLLNSGNVFFRTEKTKPDNLSKTIENILEKTYGWPIRVIIRPLGELQKLADSEPFKGINVTAQTRLYVTFLADQEICNVIQLSNGKDTTDMMKNLEKKHGKDLTTRNWNTIIKILKLNI